MRIVAVLSLLAALGASAAPVSVTVAPSNTSFKEAMAACPGAMAGISFTLGHLRVAEQAGVDSDLDDADPTAQTLTLTAADGGTASVKIDAKTRTVIAKNVKLSGTSVACVSPD